MIDDENYSWEPFASYHVLSILIKHNNEQGWAKEVTDQVETRGTDTEETSGTEDVGC